MLRLSNDSSRKCWNVDKRMRCKCKWHIWNVAAQQQRKAEVQIDDDVRQHTVQVRAQLKNKSIQVKWLYMAAFAGATVFGSAMLPAILLGFVGETSYVLWLNMWAVFTCWTYCVERKRRHVFIKMTQHICSTVFVCRPEMSEHAVERRGDASRVNVKSWPNMSALFIWGTYMDIKFGSAVVKNRFNFSFLGTQHVYCVHITLEMPLKHGSVCQFFRSDFFLSQHGKKTKLVQHLKVVHVFNTMSCGREEEVKLLVSAFSFAFTVSIFPSFSSGPYFFLCQLYFFSVRCPRYFNSLCSFLFVSTLSFSFPTCSFMSALSLNFNPIVSFLSSIPSLFVSTPFFSSQPCSSVSTLSFCPKVRLLRCSLVLWFQPTIFVSSFFPWHYRFHSTLFPFRVDFFHWFHETGGRIEKR